MFDLLIQNGQIYDGSGSAAFIGDIGIREGKIRSVASGLSGGRQVIDAKGLSVSPGWIDSHSHSDGAIFTWPDQKEKVEQGITFSITGQCGGSAAPTPEETAGAFLQRAALTPQGSSSAMLIGHNSLRKAVMGTENRDPNPEEMEKMKVLLAEGLDGGAIGMSLGLFYVPGCYAKPEEVLELAKVVAAKGGILVSHIRNEGDTLLEAVEEYLDIIKKSGCRAVFSHHKAAWKENHGKVRHSLAMIDRANAEGADIYLDVYPYDASHTSMLARFVPKQFHPAGTTSALALLENEEIREKIKVWGRQRWGNDLSSALVTEFPGGEEMEGKNVNEIADLWGMEDRFDAAFEVIRRSGGRAQGCYFSMSPEDVAYVIAHPRAMICTDASVAGHTEHYHPRLRAAFPRALGRYAGETGVVSVPEMIRKMTSMPAHVYGLDTKGRIAEGMNADLCIFDSKTICDRATYQHCSLNNEGLAYVIIDGKIVLEQGIYNGIRAGKVFRRCMP